MKTLPTYFETNPMRHVADHYGLDWDNEVLAVTGGDIHVDYETYRRWTISGVVVAIYRLSSGLYELTHYRAK